MPGPGVTQDGEKVSMVELDTPKPVLYARDYLDIWKSYWQPVHSRIRRIKGKYALILKAPLDCDDVVMEAAQQRALKFIQFNHENPVLVQQRASGA